VNVFYVSKRKTKNYEFDKVTTDGVTLKPH